VSQSQFGPPTARDRRCTSWTASASRTPAATRRPCSRSASRPTAACSRWAPPTARCACAGTATRGPRPRARAAPRRPGAYATARASARPTTAISCAGAPRRRPRTTCAWRRAGARAWRPTTATCASSGAARPDHPDHRDGTSTRNLAPGTARPRQPQPVGSRVMRNPGTRCSLCSTTCTN
jgi:hypothetical protein